LFLYFRSTHNISNEIIHIELWKNAFKILPLPPLEYSIHPIYFSGIADGEYISKTGNIVSSNSNPREMDKFRILIVEDQIIIHHSEDIQRRKK
jgi:hypothetical protein